jgi:hypothetical protein
VSAPNERVDLEALKQPTATDEDLQLPQTELTRDPTMYRLGQQRFYEMLVEVMGA